MYPDCCYCWVKELSTFSLPYCSVEGVQDVATVGGTILSVEQREELDDPLVTPDVDNLPRLPRKGHFVPALVVENIVIYAASLVMVSIVFIQIALINTGVKLRAGRVQRLRKRD
ncbi:hypothetical protein DVH24_002402 [Malus domestica]|uniref:Uncharacterized protein n=1 Tax=Malus domestica TaxID=3750 RepID=A0A498IHI4_MALDO|nr:hypothetical protein DVH24_002402 [Malus domestica]